MKEIDLSNSSIICLTFHCRFLRDKFFFLTQKVLDTLDSGIDVAPGTFGKNNKHSPLKKHIPLHQMIDFRTFFYELLSLIRT